MNETIHLKPIGYVMSRPNPIGITAVRIIRTGTDHLEVQGLDAIDGTRQPRLKCGISTCNE